MRQRKWSVWTWLGRLALAVFVLLLAPALVWGALSSQERTQAFVLAVVLLPGLLWVVPRLARQTARLGAGRALLLLGVACFCLKLAWVLLVRLPPAGDYAVYWGYANALAEREVIFGGRYMALFPHLFGYSAFLSWFVRLFGSHTLLPVVLNVVLSTLSGVLLFFLGRRMLGVEAGCTALAFWTLCPSQTMYNAMILSEPLYTTLLLAVLLLASVALDRNGTEGAPAGLLLGSGAGVLLAGVNMTRPVGVIVRLTILLWTFCIRGSDWGKRAFRRRGICFLAALLLVCVGAGKLGEIRMEQRIGEEAAPIPGYSILVGFQPDSDGRWNQADSDRLARYNAEPGISAPEVQQKLLADAVERITSGEVPLLHLMQEKLRIFLGEDDACVGYSATVVRHRDFFALACNGFYYACALLALVGAVRMAVRGDRSALFLPVIYTVGLILAQLLVEVAGRYHYSILPMLMLLACGAFWKKMPEEQNSVM